MPKPDWLCRSCIYSNRKYNYMNFRNDIQGLRALAVLLVFIFHLSATLLPGGFIGVDVFFVISGFLVTNIVYGKINKGTFSLSDFYKSRIQRIVPAYAFMLLIVSVAVTFLFINTDSYSYRKSLFWALIFGSNNFFATLNTYFGADSNENPLLHTWTLAVEMQFYLLLPVALLFIRKKQVLISLLAVLTLALFSYASYEIASGNAAIMYFSLPARVPEFLLGAIAAIIRLEDYHFVRKQANVLSIVGLVTIIGCALFLSEHTPFPGIVALIPCLGTIAILVSSTSWVNSFLGSKPLVFIGEISYSVYLWHWPIMAFFRYYKNTYAFTLLESALVILATIILSFLSYYVVEKKLRKAQGASFLIPLGIVGGLSAGMVFLAPHINERLNQLPRAFVAPSYGLDSHGETFKHVERLGDRGAGTSQILLLGDSHALTMKKYLNDIGERHGFSFKTITNDTYPTLPGLTKQHFDGTKYYEQYSRLMRHAEQEIPKADLIILQFAGGGQRWASALQFLLAQMGEKQRLIVLEDYPGVDKNPVRINKSIVRRAAIKQQYKVVQTKISPQIRQIIAADSRATYLDLTDNKIFEDVPFYRDSLLYYDKSHLNEYGAKVYGQETEKLLLKAIFNRHFPITATRVAGK
ncbi:acyltransferase family protein [Sphingobacterium kitahiroshimense]|uniref:Acyltransferase family protein n=1 Tax=Sphingobacterium kitahiroshimense TaxID=470446 RepID=A0ABV0BWJ8_9SPHI